MRLLEHIKELALQLNTFCGTLPADSSADVSDEQVRVITIFSITHAGSCRHAQA